MSILGIGTVVEDTVVQLPAFPTADTKNAVLRHWRQFGGPVPVALATAAHFGSACRFVGRWGEDSAGRFISAELGERGVDATLSQTQQNWSTGFAHVWTEPSGTRTIAYSRGELPLPGAEAVSDRVIMEHNILHLDGWAGDLAIHAAEVIKQRQGTVVLDAGSSKPRMDELLPLVDILVASRQFCESWFGGREYDDDELLQTGCSAAVLTHGPDGATVVTGDSRLAIEGRTVDAVDTNGAGDIFSGALLSQIDAGASLYDAAEFANIVAAYSCEQYGNFTLPGPEYVAEVRAEGG